MFTFRKLTLAAAFGVAALSASVLLAPRAANAQLTTPNTLVYDSITGGTLTATGSTPRNATGTAVSLVNPLPTNTISPVSLIGADVIIRSIAVGTFTNVQFTLNFFGVATLDTSTTGNAYSNPLASYSYNFGQITTGNTNYIFTGLNFPAVTVPNIANLGFSIVVRADSGAGLVANDNFTSAFSTYTGQVAVGTNTLTNGGFSAYYRNASGLQTGNFLGTDGRNLGTNTSLAFRLYAAAVPEPGSIALVALGGLPLMGVVLRRRRK